MTRCLVASTPGFTNPPPHTPTHPHTHKHSFNSKCRQNVIWRKESNKYLQRKRSAKVDEWGRSPVIICLRTCITELFVRASVLCVWGGGLMQTVHYSVKENGLLFRSVTVASAHSDTAIYTERVLRRLHLDWLLIFVLLNTIRINGGT